MVKYSSRTFALVLWFAINIATAKERCEDCLPATECHMYSSLTKEQQQMWIEKYICDEPSSNESLKTDKLPDFSSEGKRDFVCCPDNIWGISDAISVNKDNLKPATDISGGVNQSQINQDSEDLSFEYNFDEFDNEDFDKPIWTNRPQLPTQNPFFLPTQNTNDNNFSETSSDKQCSLSRYPPEVDSGCCGIEASDSIISYSTPSAQNVPQQSSNRNRRFNWMPQMSSSSFWPFSWTGFHEEDNGNMAREKRQVNDTVTVSIDNRIAGGKETDLKQFPWTALLKTTFKYPNKESAFSCGGSLISSKFVLTAGHCVYDSEGKVKSIEVSLAEYDKRTFPRDCKFMLSRGEVCIDNVVMYAEHFTIHPEYNDERLLNDIALIRLRGNAPYTDYIRPICLPTVDVDTPDLSNLKLTAAGWGRNGLYKSDVKQSTVVNLIPQNDCKKSYPDLTRKQLCAAGYSGEDTCKGDSGGPLMITYKGKYQVSGIVSGKRSDAPCGTSVPSLYTNVYQYVPWIRSVIYRQQT